MTTLIDGKEIAKNLRSKLKIEIDNYFVYKFKLLIKYEMEIILRETFTLLIRI